jgi:phage shock protein PspC (stress-responsive transcriptional regulator)
LKGTSVKKLYRLNGDRKVAGVCSGLAEYFDIDPIITRLVFLFSLFFGGLGAIAYLVMWIMVPLKEGAPVAHSGLAHLHLSASDRKIGGVCGGLGEYSGLDPVFFRAGFLVTAFFCGTGVLLYFVLWMLVPRAQVSLSDAGPAVA